MSDYQFQLIAYNREGILSDKGILHKRPFTRVVNSFEADARHFVPGEQLEIAMNTSIAVGEPLLITGEPGTGKTQAAYYAAYKLGIEPVLHFQVKSDSSARDLLYYFDNIRYFHDAHFLKENTTLSKADYVEPRALWLALTSEVPRVLLIDEVDKAPRDFPNDLLHELDKMEFTVTETGEKISAPAEKRPIVFITSNSERRLPEPFLRRCVYHHIHFDEAMLSKVVESRRNEFTNLSQDFLKLAIQRFLALRDKGLAKQPSTGEMLIWLRVLALTIGNEPQQLMGDLSGLPYLGVLLKNQQDMEKVNSKPQV
jgi:MoxR-like ATPase